MKVIEIKVYKFEELSPEAQARAIKTEIQRQYEYLELDTFNEDAKEQIKDAGFINPVLSYSLSYSQGDGLSFKADGFNKLTDLFIEVLGPGKEKTAKLLADNCTVILKGNTGHYCYAKRDQIDLYIENYTSSINVTNTDRIDEVVSKALRLLEDIYLDLCKKLEKQGYSEIEYLTSEECAKENLIANDVEFTADGKIF